MDALAPEATRFRVLPEGSVVLEPGEADPTARGGYSIVGPV